MSQNLQEDGIIPASNLTKWGYWQGIGSEGPRQNKIFFSQLYAQVVWRPIIQPYECDHHTICRNIRVN